MSLLPSPQLKTETVSFAGTDLVLHELSAYDRCEYLEQSTAHLPMPKDGGEVGIEFNSLDQLWAMRRATVSGQLLLVAYALKPGRDESVDELHKELCRSIPAAQVDTLYVPAAKLSGLFEGEENVADADDDDDEDGEKKG